MGAVIIAGIVFVLSVIGAGLVMFGKGMSDSVGNDMEDAALSPWSVLIGGSIISAFILSTHWIHIGW